MNYLVFALHGNQPRYTTGMIHNVGSMPRVYGPGWNALIYHDTTVPGQVIAQLRATGLVVLRRVDSSTRPHWTAYPGRFWRLLALEDPLVRSQPGALVCHRDADSRISSREVQATMDFYMSGKLIHIMKDHPNHSSRVWLSGMWDWRVSPNRKRLAWIVDEADRYNEEQLSLRRKPPWSDDYFLGRRIYHKLKRTALEHDTFAGTPFPGLTGPGPFVGEVILVDEENKELPSLPEREQRDRELTKLYRNGKLIKR